MSIKDQLLHDIGSIQDSRLLSHIWEYVKLLRDHFKEEESNVEEVIKCAGSLSNEDASEIIDDVEHQFNKLEGEW